MTRMRIALAAPQPVARNRVDFPARRGFIARGGPGGRAS
jgi:hypothetical protein